ncbi:SDR family oxidoreductase [Flindersiella endophytica]
MILVTGATGNVGRNVVAQLLDAGEQVRATSRDPGRATFPAGVEVVRADLAQPETLGPALEGVDKLFLFPAPGGLDGFAEAAKLAGVRHVVLLSAMMVSFGKPNPVEQWHAAAERIVAESGATWTYLRPGQFMSNDLMWAGMINADGTIRAAYGQAATAPVDERDIAAVAVAALREDGHEGKVYDLTGPESLTTVDRVRILGDALGRELRFDELTREQGIQALSAYMPLPVIEATFDYWAGSVGSTAPTLPTVENVTGRPARTYAQWAADHASAFTARAA